MLTAERLVRDRQLLFDLCLCALVSVVTTGYSLAVGERALGLASLVVTLPLLVRRAFPAAAFVMMTAGCLFSLAVSQLPSAAGIVSVPIMVYTLARWSPRTLARLGWAVGVVGSVLGPARWALGGGGLTDVTVFMVSVVACLAVVSGTYVVGRKLRESEDSAGRQRSAEAERVRLLESEQEQRERAATVDERNRIARELHDIVAHSLSVIVVQAEGGRALATRHPERAGEVLGTIAETGREALTETRRILGVLRDGRGDASTAYGPQPGLADIADLVRRTSERAELTTFGTAPPLSPAVGLTAYRVVQESLTNVLKHAGPDARARVVVACTADAVEIEVVDDGGGAAAVPPPDGQGHGLRGMAERVSLHDGELSAGPGANGGFVVRAWIPYERAVETQPDLPRVVAW
ncbi:sensor histidine kinase [Microlunatus flavus]|uniref:histidine kinase n=1 Tax=Microlunatus flavus TaxID=1036181 RepID=A0A1H9AP34_9ACTN|nr:sensor histidine kinase [Microlunatus flavus]SEP78460.1 Signal transduction histidine kinase [Microlunatus flavus]